MIPSVPQKERVEITTRREKRERYEYELLPRVRLVGAAFDNSPMGLWMHERFEGLILMGGMGGGKGMR
jgi:hypothetical protein